MSPPPQVVVLHHLLQRLQDLLGPVYKRWLGEAGLTGWPTPCFAHLTVCLRDYSVSMQQPLSFPLQSMMSHNLFNSPLGMCLRWFPDIWYDSVVTDKTCTILVPWLYEKWPSESPPFSVRATEHNCASVFLQGYWSRAVMKGSCIRHCANHLTWIIIVLYYLSFNINIHINMVYHLWNINIYKILWKLYKYWL